MRPYRFTPVNIATVWGTEEWILSAMEGRQTVCGCELSALVEKYGARLVGEKVWNRFGNRFPLLIKHINARQQLSVQVHPNDAMAKGKDLPNGKTEMWYVIQAAGDSELLVGFRKRFTAPEFNRIVANSISEEDVQKGEKTLENVLNRFRPQKGDWYYIPAGTVHSIGAGVKLLEIQQPSDTTYRLYDFNRLDKDGKKRRLDVKDALMAIDFEETLEKEVEVQRNVFAPLGSPATPTGNVRTEPMVSCEYFTTKFLDFTALGNSAHPVLYNHDYSDTGSFSVIVCTGGNGKLFFCPVAGSCIKEMLPIKDGDLYLLPAELKCVQLQSVSDLQIVEIHI